jgi:hypothetical protein
MKVEAPEVKRQVRVINLGDVIAWPEQNDSYIVMKVYDSNGATVFQCRNFNGLNGLNGFHNSLELLATNLKQRLDNGTYIHYPASKYKLVLQEV